MSPRTPRLDSIQILRALAALAIVLQHAFHETGLSSLEHLPWGIGVDAFFIISGFIMMHTAGHTFAQPGAPQTFALRRLIRIVPPYWFFTTLMLIAALAVPGQLQTTVFTPAHALQSYLFWPHLNPAEPTTIHPLLGVGWTLVYEMFFYLCFTLALFFRRPTGLILLTASFILLFISARAGVYTPAFNLFWGNSVMFDFLLGILAQLMLNSRQPNHATLKPILVLTAFTLFALAIATLGHLFAERFFLWGLPAFLLFLLFTTLKPHAHHPLTRFLTLLGNASYTLYLSHPFVLQTLKMLHAPIQLYIPIGLAAAAAFAILFYLWAENPLHRRLSNRLFYR